MGLNGAPIAAPPFSPLCRSVNIFRQKYFLFGRCEIFDCLDQGELTFGGPLVISLAGTRVVAVAVPIVWMRYRVPKAPSIWFP